MATSDKLNKLLQTKEAIRLALIEKGQNATTNIPFADYANMISGIITATGDIEVEIIGGSTPTDPTPDLVNVLKAGTAKIGGSTNAWVDNVRTPGDAIPVSSPFELRQWAANWAGMNVPATDLKPETVYTLVLEVEFLNDVDNFWLELGQNWFGGSFLADNKPITVKPSAGQYPLKQHVNPTGKTKFYYKFISGADVPSSHLLGIRADNAADDTKVMYHRFEIFEGDVNP